MQSSMVANLLCTSSNECIQGTRYDVYLCLYILSVYDNASRFVIAVLLRQVEAMVQSFATLYV